MFLIHSTNHSSTPGVFIEDPDVQKTYEISYNLSQPIMRLFTKSSHKNQDLNGFAIGYETLR